MDYQPHSWKRHHIYLGITIMLLGVFTYVGASYLFFTIESVWLRFSMGLTLLALSLVLISIGFTTANSMRQTKAQHRHSDAVRATRDPRLKSTGDLFAKSSTD